MSKCSSGSHRERILLARLLAGMQRLVRKCLKRLEARVGFEPTNGGFADLSLGPLGYRANRLNYNKTRRPLRLRPRRQILRHPQVLVTRARRRSPRARTARPPRAESG